MIKTFERNYKDGSVIVTNESGKINLSLDDVIHLRELSTDKHEVRTRRIRHALIAYKAGEFTLDEAADLIEKE